MSEQPPVGAVVGAEVRAVRFEATTREYVTTSVSEAEAFGVYQRIRGDDGHDASRWLTDVDGDLDEARRVAAEVAEGGPVDELIERDPRIEIHALASRPDGTLVPGRLAEADTFSVFRVVVGPDGASPQWLDDAPTLRAARDTAFLHGNSAPSILQVPADAPPPPDAAPVGFTALPLVDGQPGRMDVADGALIRPLLRAPSSDVLYRGGQVDVQTAADSDLPMWIDSESEHSMERPYFPVSPATVDALVRASAGDDGIDAGERAAAIGGIATVADNQARTMSRVSARPGPSAARDLRAGARELRASAARLEAIADNLEARGPDSTSSSAAYASRQFDEANRRYRGPDDDNAPRQH